MLLKLLDDLVKQNTTPDEIIQQDNEIDSTTPVKEDNKKKKRKREPGAKLVAAKKRALEMFGTRKPEIVVNQNVVSHSSFDSLQKTVVEAHGYQDRRSEDYCDEYDSADSHERFTNEDEEGYQDSDADQECMYGDFGLDEQDEELSPLPKPRHNHGHTSGSVPKKVTPAQKRFVTSQVCRSPILCNSATPNRPQLKKPKKLSPSQAPLSVSHSTQKIPKNKMAHSHSLGPDVSISPGYTSITIPQKSASVPGEATSAEVQHAMKGEPKHVELLPNYGIYLTQMQLDAAVGQGNNPTKLMRNLLGCFFTSDVLAISSALGTKSANEPLDPDILGACIQFVQRKFPGTSRTVLIDATNDKCANYRRKKRSTGY